MGLTVTKEDKRIMNNSKVKQIFDYWVDKKIIQHRKISKHMAFSVKLKIEEYGIDSCFEVIDNYNQILNDKKYFFSYKFSLTRLMSTQMFHKFLTDGEHWQNYIDRVNRKDNKKEQLANEDICTIEVDEELENKYQEVLNSLKSMPYNQYLSTEHWKHFKKKAIQNQNGKCQICNIKDTLLNVHHNNYKNRGRENYEDVIVICNKCHKKIHD